MAWVRRAGTDPASPLWIVACGLTMDALVLVGAVTLVLRTETGRGTTIGHS